MENISKVMSDKLKGLRAEHIDVGIFLEMLQLYNTSPVIFFEQIYGKLPLNDDNKQE